MQVRATLLTFFGSVSVAAALLASLGGCSKMPAVSHDGDLLWPGNDHRLVGQEPSPIPDVPMPIGFEPVVSRCRSSVVGKTRLVDHTYQGKASLKAVADLYRRDLRLNRWRAAEDSVSGDDLLLRYHKGREALQITINRNTLLTTVKVRIRALGDPELSQHPGHYAPEVPGAQTRVAADTLQR